MATAAEIQAQLDTLRLARAQGVLSMRHGDTMTTFRSLDELDRIIAGFVRELGAQRPMNIVIRSEKGW